MQPPEKLCSKESETIGNEFVNNWSHFLSLLQDNGEKGLYRTMMDKHRYGFDIVTTILDRDVLSLLSLLENIRSKWQKSEAAALHYKEKNASYEKKMKALKDENSSLNDKLLNCQSQLSHVSEVKRAIEDELGDYKAQWEKLRNIIKSNDDALISDGLLAIIKANVSRHPSTKTLYRNDETNEISAYDAGQSDIDYDGTVESVFDSSPEEYAVSVAGPSQRRISRKRPSSSTTPKMPRPLVRFDDLEPIPAKRSKNMDDIEITATIRFDSTNIITKKPTGIVKIRRSQSESDLLQAHKEIINIKPRQPLTPHFNAAGSSTFNLQTPLGFAGSWTQGNNIDQRHHHGELISFPISFSCDVCNKRFGFTKNAYECRDCNLRYHQKCRIRSTIPCIPKIKIPKTPSKSKNALVDFCPKSHPFIPPLLIHCVFALEREHLKQEGIYRISGPQSGVKELYQQFMSTSSRIAPDLTNVPWENITGCIKMFLKGLRDSVIPSTSYNDFVQAIDANDDQAIIQVVFDLPAPCRDTLAYLVLHLQKVAAHSNRNKMPIENLACVLAPTIVGYSNLLSKQESIENSYIINENQKVILLRLLKLPTEFWNRFIENNMSAVLAAEARTPGSRTELLTLTPTTTVTQSSSGTSSSRRGTPKMPPKARSNNNQFLVDFTDDAAESSQLLQPLSNATTSSAMRGIIFKPAF